MPEARVECAAQWAGHARTPPAQIAVLDDAIYFESGEGEASLLLRVPVGGEAFTMVSSPHWWRSPLAP